MLRIILTILMHSGVDHFIMLLICHAVASCELRRFMH